MVITTYILVCDGAHAKVFSCRSNHHELEFVHGFSGSHLLTHEIVSDRPGRAFDRQGFGRHSYEEATDPHEHRKEVFVHRVLRWLDDAKLKDQYDNLIVVAPPHALGLIRKARTNLLEKNTKEEVPKDLVHATKDAVWAHVHQALG